MNITWTRETLTSEQQTSVAQLNRIVDDLCVELRRRGYEQPYVSFQIANTPGFYISTIGHTDAGSKQTSFYARAEREKFHSLLSVLQEKLDEHCPDRDVLLRSEFNAAFERLATLADAIGEKVPGYATFATILRESRRSNLLENHSTGDTT